MVWVRPGIPDNPSAKKDCLNDKVHILTNIIPVKLANANYKEARIVQCSSLVIALLSKCITKLQLQSQNQNAFCHLDLRLLIQRIRSRTSGFIALRQLKRTADSNVGCDGSKFSICSNLLPISISFVSLPLQTFHLWVGGLGRYRYRTS